MDISKIKVGSTSYDVKDAVAREKVTPILYDDLVTLRNNSQLIPGQQYRITDYECTVSEWWVKSAGHQFDIIVTALTTNTLSEQASASLHEGDSYFANCDLGAWKLWYSLDNNSNKMYYAIDTPKISCSYDEMNYYVRDTTHDVDGSLHPYAWTGPSDVQFYTDVETPTAGGNVYIASDTAEVIDTINRYYPKGKGVIYRMIDEHNNDVSYDFKNFMFRGYQTDTNGYYAFHNEKTEGAYYMWFYTFSKRTYYPITEELNGTDVDSGDYSLTDTKAKQYDNFITTRTKFSFEIILCNLGGNNDYFRHNIFCDVKNVMLTRGAQYNNVYHTDTLYVYSRSGSSIYFGNNYVCRSSIQAGGSVMHNIFVNSIIQCPKTGAMLNNNKIYHSTVSATQLRYCDITTSTLNHTSAAQYLYMRNSSLTVSVSGMNNSKLINSKQITSDKGYIQNVKMSDCQYVTITSNQTTSSSNYIQNLEIKNVKGTSSAAKIISHNTVNDDFVTTYQPANSQTISV